MGVEQEPKRHVQQHQESQQLCLVDRQQVLDGLEVNEQSWPHDPVHVDGGANDHTGESTRFRESLVLGVGLCLEQKETKETERFVETVAKLPGGLVA